MRLGYRVVRAVASILFRFLYGVEVSGVDNVPRSGRVILAVNHRSNFDPPLVGSIVRREVHYFAKEELFKCSPVARFLRYLNAFPVRRGRFDRTALDMCLSVLKRDQGLVFFPEGTRAPDDGFLRAKLGVGWVAHLSGAPILPVYLHGTQSIRPRLRGRPAYSVVFGKPVDVAELADKSRRGRELYQQISDSILELIRDLSLATPGGRVVKKGEIYEREIIPDEKLR